MRRALTAGWLLGLLATTPLFAHEPPVSLAALAAAAPAPVDPDAGTVPAAETPAPPSEEVSAVDSPAWQAPWGLAAIRIIPAGPKTAPNGEEYHPNFSMDLDFNTWVWRCHRLYGFADLRFWGEKGEYGVTNSRDGFFGTSKREFDFSGGAAWNYWGNWEARASGYSMSNLNRGTNLVTPYGFTDGSELENRYYLSPEYAKLGEPGFDVARASFLSVGYYPSKDMVGNDGRSFKPGPMLRAYLIRDLWDWPCYAFGDFTVIGESSFRPKLLLFDVGAAVRPFSSFRQCEFRLGTESTADFQVRDVQNLWYVSFRYIF